ncbi:hypothetical protein COOONC_00526 [Cooperia oncophora]
MFLAYETVKLKIGQYDRKPLQERSSHTQWAPWVTFNCKYFPFQFHRLQYNIKGSSPITIQPRTWMTTPHSVMPPSTTNTLTNQCSTKDTCKCNPAEDTVSCYCTQNDISQTRQLAKVLPLPIPNGIVAAGPKKIPQIHTTAFSIELAITLNPKFLHIAQNLLDFKCNVVNTGFSGCYNCFKGAVATFDCTSDVPAAIAQVTRGIRQFVLTCTREGHVNKVKLFFNHARVKEQCRVQRSSHTTILELQGLLNYISGVRPFWKYSRVWQNTPQDDPHFQIDWDFPDKTYFLDICKQFYIFTAIILISLPGAIIISTTYLCATKTAQPTTASTASTVPGFCYQPTSEAPSLSTYANYLSVM